MLTGDIPRAGMAGASWCMETGFECSDCPVAGWSEPVPPPRYLLACLGPFIHTPIALTLHAPACHSPAAGLGMPSVLRLEWGLMRQGLQRGPDLRSCSLGWKDAPARKTPQLPSKPTRVQQARDPEKYQEALSLLTSLHLFSPLKGWGEGMCLKKHLL